jgi:CBS domain-containing protein
MTATLAPKSVTLRLHAETAADLMIPNPISVRADANVREALNLLTDKGFSAAPVIDEAGRPVGVLSRSDLLVHEREYPHHVPRSPAFFYEEEMHTKLPDGFHEEEVDPTAVRDVMTPAIFSVAPDTPASKVVFDMVGLRVHRLFVVDPDGTLVGVISTMDILRHLKA